MSRSSFQPVVGIIGMGDVSSDVELGQTRLTLDGEIVRPSVQGGGYQDVSEQFQLGL